MSTSGVQPLPNIFSVLSNNSLEFESGATPVGTKSTSVGNSQGKFSAPTNFATPDGEYTIGMGVPQYRCREIDQSLNL